MEVIYKANDNLVELDALKNATTDAYINDATVTLTAIKDADGNTVAGTANLSMAYVAGSNGKYQANVPHTVTLNAGRRYTAVIDAVSGSLDGHWEVPVICRVRTG